MQKVFRLTYRYLQPASYMGIIMSETATYFAECIGVRALTVATTRTAHVLYLKCITYCEESKPVCSLYCVKHYSQCAAGCTTLSCVTATTLFLRLPSCVVNVQPAPPCLVRLMHRYPSHYQPLKPVCSLLHQGIL